MGQVTRHVWENYVSFLELRNFVIWSVAIFRDFQQFAEMDSDVAPRDEDGFSNLLRGLNIPRIS